MSDHSHTRLLSSTIRFDLPLHYTKDGKVVFKEWNGNNGNDDDDYDDEEGNTDDDDYNDEDDDDDGFNDTTKPNVNRTLAFWKKTLEEQFPDMDIVIQKRSGRFDNNLSSGDSSSGTSGMSQCGC